MEIDGVYHVYDRGNDRRTIFRTPEEFDFFVEQIRNARAITGVRVLAFCLMPNHWHLLVQPRLPRDLSRFVAWLKQVHTRHFRAAGGTLGEGHLYQARFRSRLLESDDAIVACCRYVERNALSAGMVTRAEDWRWGSLWHRMRPDLNGLIDPMPVHLPEEWVGIVNAE